MGVIAAVAGATLGLIGGAVQKNNQKKAAKQNYQIQRDTYWDNVKIAEDKLQEYKDQTQLRYDGNTDALNLLSAASSQATGAMIAANNSAASGQTQANIKAAMETIAVNNETTQLQIEMNTFVVGKMMGLTVASTNTKTAAVAGAASARIGAAKTSFEMQNKTNTIIASSQMGDVINKAAASVREKAIQGQKKIGKVAAKGEGITAGVTRAREITEAQIAVNKDIAASKVKGKSMIHQIADRQAQTAVRGYANTREKQIGIAASANSQIAIMVAGARETLGRMGLQGDQSNMMAEIANYKGNTLTAIGAEKSNAMIAAQTSAANARAAASGRQQQAGYEASRIRLNSQYEADMLKEVYIPPFRGVEPDSGWSFGDFLEVGAGALSGGASAVNSYNTISSAFA